MLDLCYVVGPGEDNEELRYSLRSVAANLPHRRVVIAGHAPAWTRTGRIHVEQAQTKHVNALANLRAILACDELTPDVVIFNDDHYVTAPIQAVEPLHCGPLGDRVALQSEPYQVAIHDTLHLLALLGYRGEPDCYDLHVPFPANRQDLRRTLDTIAHRTYYLPPDRAQRILWQTVHAALHDYDGAYSPDVKIRDGQPRPAWPAPFMSTEDSTYWGAAGRLLRHLFPKPCRYEEP